MDQIYLVLTTTSHGQRLNGPFRNEYVVGSYLSKFFFISLIFLILARKNHFFSFISSFYFSNNSTFKRKNSFSNVVFMCGIFISFLSKITFKTKVLYLLIFLIFCISLISSNESIKNHLIIRSLDQIELVIK